MRYGISKQRNFLYRLLFHRIWSVLLVIFCVILLFLGHGKDNSLADLRQKISTYTAPVLAALSSPFTMANEAVEGVGRLVSLKEEVDRLTEENEKLRHLRTVASQKDIKLKQLQSFLNLKVDPRIEYLTTRVIADVSSPYKESMRLDAGRVNQVQKGLAVMDQNGLMGQIISTSEDSSIVLLISDINSRIPVRLEPGGVSAMLVGHMDKTVELKYLPYGHKLKEGAKIYTSGHGALLPAGIPIGQVKLKDQKSVVDVFANLKSANYVKILSLRHEDRERVPQAVMKSPPPQKIREELVRAQIRELAQQNGGSLKTGTSPQEAGSNLSLTTLLKNGTAGLFGNEQLSQATFLDLEKGPYAKKRKTYRSYRQRYSGWRYRQSYRDRRWQAQVFSGTVN